MCHHFGYTLLLEQKIHQFKIECEITKMLNHVQENLQIENKQVNKFIVTNTRHELCLHYKEEKVSFVSSL